MIPPKVTLLVQQSLTLLLNCSCILPNGTLYCEVDMSRGPDVRKHGSHFTGTEGRDGIRGSSGEIRATRMTLYYVQSFGRFKQEARETAT